MTVTPESRSLVHCHNCGYEIPDEPGTRCPECGEVWDVECQALQLQRDGIEDRFVSHLKKQTMLWFIVLVAFSIGGFVASGMMSVFTFLYVFFGIGFGIVTSFGLGIGICKLGPRWQFKSHADAWMRSLWWFHGPWLMIAPLTIIGSIPAFIFRFVDPVSGEAVIMVVVILEFLTWFIGLFFCLGIGLEKYNSYRDTVGLRNIGSVSILHILFAIAIWIGSIIVGFFGGMLGAIFMVSILDPQMMNF